MIVLVTVSVLLCTSIRLFRFLYLIRVYFVSLNMDRNSHAAFWSDSPSQTENRYRYEFISGTRVGADSRAIRRSDYETDRGNWLISACCKIDILIFFELIK